MKFAETVPQIQFDELLRDTLAQSGQQQSVLCVHICGLTQSLAEKLNVTLALFSLSSGGPLTLSELEDGSFAIVMAGWPLGRARQVARIIRAIVRAEQRLNGDDVDITLLPLQGGDAGVEALLDASRRLRNTASTRETGMGK